MALRILLAPDKFKGTLDASAAGAAMALGVRDVAPGAEVKIRPLADGGEGTLDCIAAVSPGTFFEVSAEDAFGSPVTARVYDTGGTLMTAMHETARLPARPAPSGALRASSRGTGLVLDAVSARFPGRPLVLFVGGSASTDGGAGAAQACGWRLLDGAGRALAPGGGALRLLARIDPPPAAHEWNVTAACDVDAPLLGPAGAAALFAPQKGAGPAEVRLLEEGLTNLAGRLATGIGRDVAGLPGAGAGGGMGAGIAAFFGGGIVNGFDVVAAATSLDEDLAWAELVVTGEGLVDAGTLGGKVVSRVAARCAAAGKPCGVVTGEVRLPAERLPAHAALGVAAVAELVSECGRRAAFAAPEACIRSAAAKLVARMSAPG